MVKIALKFPAYATRLFQGWLPQTSGVASCHPHFGELLQGAFDMSDGRRRRMLRALVSVHIPDADGSVARVTLEPNRRGKFLPEAGRTGIHVSPVHFSKCALAVRLALDAFGMKNMAATLQVTTFVPEGAGMGSSTSGVVASIRAAAEAVSAYRGTRIIPAPHLQAKLAVAAERASDSLMFDCMGSTILFAQRVGRIARTISGPLPRMHILGFDTGSSGGGINTDQLPRARYSPDQIAAFGCSLAVLERAVAEQSVALAGKVATFSATMSETAMQYPLKKPKFGELLRIKEGTGSAGIVVAHSGTVAGLIFDPALPDLRTRVGEASTAIVKLGFDRLRTFSSPY
ncbi:GHMP family kinase ATP-binding protein [Bradyrhizobium sp. CCBAU 21362]|uniref:GHMP family kinase ATP-binding protein n=1 Tax=Bradyrhizobium sp. CCBAU 21362 TaxID=1325082 RepID=UPI00230629E6|nr:hypothetical protein [Bradyrhizobium sp. CCBAU 21362]